MLHNFKTKHIDEARIERKRRKGKDDNYRYYSTECMMGLYIPVLLVKGYGFSNTTRQLTAVKRIREQKIGMYAKGTLILVIND